MDSGVQFLPWPCGFLGYVSGSGEQPRVSRRPIPPKRGVAAIKHQAYGGSTVGPGIDGEPLRSSGRGRRSDERRWIGRTGTRRGTVNTVIDVTERKQVELAARQRVPRAHRRS